MGNLNKTTGGKEGKQGIIAVLCGNSHIRGKWQRNVAIKLLYMVIRPYKDKRLTGKSHPIIRKFPNIHKWKNREIVHIFRRKSYFQGSFLYPLSGKEKLR